MLSPRGAITIIAEHRTLSLFIGHSRQSTTRYQEVFADTSAWGRMLSQVGSVVNPHRAQKSCISHSKIEEAGVHE
jgi:hypothetical protein